MNQFPQRMLPALLAALVFPAGVVAQPSGGPERLAVEVSEACAEGKSDALAAALRARVDEREIAPGASGAPVLRWKSEEGRCVLELVRSDETETPPTLELEADADSPEIRNAVSRIAWLLNTRRRPVAPPEPESRSEEEKPPADAEQSPEESDQEESTKEKSSEEQSTEEQSAEKAAAPERE